MAERNEWYRPCGSLARADWDCVVDSALPGWQHAGLRVATLDGAAISLPTGPVERMFVPLSGSFQITYENGSTDLRGRASVFDGPTDVLYLGADTAASLRGVGRIAVAEGVAAVQKQSRYIPREDVAIELRGAGRDTRQVHNFGMPSALDAATLIVCEVITPAGNWSSHPAHKHDARVPERESQLEEIYYFEVTVARGILAPSEAEPFGLFATYSSPAGEIETTTVVHQGDVALIPFGYHGPAIAAPEYDLYYLNVMAGSDPERVWLVSDDPRQAWIRQQWKHRMPDARLPYVSAPDERTHR